MRLRLDVPAGAVLALIAVLATLCGVALGMVGDVFPLYVPAIAPNPDSVSVSIVGAFALMFGVGAAWALVRYRRRVPMLLSAAMVAGTPAVFVYGADALRPVDAIDPTTRATGILSYLSEPWVVVLGLGLLVATVPIVALLLGEGRTRTWFVGSADTGSRLRSAARFSYRRPLAWLSTVTPPVVAWLVFPVLQDVGRSVENLAFQLGPHAEQVSRGFSLILDGNTDVRAMLLAMLCLAVTFALRYRVSPQGVAMSLGSFTLLNGRWERVRWVDRMEGGGLCVHYRGRLGWPCSITLRPESIESGVQLVASAHQGVHERNLRHRTWSGAYRATVVGWSAIGLAMVLMVAQSLWSSALMAAVDGASPAQFARLAVPVEGAAFYDLTLLLFGIGVGVLGSRTAGSGSLPLVAGLMVGATVLPTPLLHWLVWIACHAVLTAIQTPVDPSTVAYSTPSELQWTVAYTLGALGPAFAAVGYLVGTTIGRRPHRLLRSPAGGSEPVAAPDAQAEPAAGALFLPGSKPAAAS